MSDNQNEDTSDQRKPEEPGQTDQPRNMTMEDLKELYNRFPMGSPIDIAEIRKRRYR